MRGVELTAAVAERADEAAELLSRIIRCPSVTGYEDEVSGVLTEWCRSHGWTVEIQPLTDTELHRRGEIADEERVEKRANVLAYPWSPTGAPLLVVNGHIDVVPPGPSEGWKDDDPFSGSRIDGVVHGRGAVDTKGGIVAALIGLDTLRRNGERPPFDVALHLVVGEERSGVGTRASLELRPRPSAAIVLEASDSRVVTASSGLIQCELAVDGATAHTSSPWLGRDAFLHLLRMHAALAARSQEQNAGLDDPAFDGIPVPLPFVAGVVSAGTYRNAVPAHAEMSVRFGLAPGQKVADAAASLTDLVASVDAGREWPEPSRLQVVAGLAGWSTPPDSRLVRAMLGAVGQVGRDTTPRALTAGSDAGFYGELGIPTVLFGPGAMSLAHGPAEHLAEQELIDAAAVIAVAVAGLEL
ncbi:M20 family metallopeptidase [Streptomyces sp. MMS24-I29]|uniref:M20 family metallopeptidase n=1 Tax=Streptomyces sp. MMS24-I29 TaxID=3351480 RepID=UPI003C7C84CB